MCHAFVVAVCFVYMFRHLGVRVVAVILSMEFSEKFELDVGRYLDRLKYGG